MLIDRVYEISSLLHKHGVGTELIGPHHKIDMRTWEDLVVSLNTELPVSLKRIFLEETSGLILCWDTSVDKFGDSCKRGYLHLLSPKEIITTYREMLEVVKESSSDPEVSSNAGLQVLVRDWPSWIPLFRFPDGDAFCIDIRNLSIVFLEHDVMDGGPYIHGTTIASSLDHLLELWDQIAFADVYDWSECCNEHGIILEKPLFNNIRSLSSLGKM
ncbi:hypothetical protein [Paenibacillus sp. R14(2021)]|uniref:hypothetical protein n=1 Tax=Paenibacillus sp. R14(2021) TaxID=2859228 RepID=UPI001C6136D3|nr:hypothetical protein [Paenibacillus sp. R14(2021)]